LLSAVKWTAPLAAMVRGHHERWDGGGYPDGLKGEEIPVGARILAVADTLDAITTDRSYRKALSLSTALAEIEAFKGAQFDPAIVDVALSIRNEDWRAIRLTHSAMALVAPLIAPVKDSARRGSRAPRSASIAG
jgi:HD-GYP domain-containing protein (c-di-GMP phosphodiesterase class II)